MQLPKPQTPSDMLEIINRVLLLLGLPIVSFDIENIPRESDAGKIHYLLQNQTREIQARGWWFNTWERFEVEAGDLLVDTNGFTPLSSAPSPTSGLECKGDHYELYNNSVISIEDAAYSVDFPTQTTLLDIIVAIDLTQCPTLFVDYVVYKTARIYGRSIGMKLDLIDEQQAANRLEIEHDRCSKQHNWFKESTIAVY